MLALDVSIFYTVLILLDTAGIHLFSTEMDRLIQNLCVRRVISLLAEIVLTRVSNVV